MKAVDYDPFKIANAITTVLEGTCKRVDIDDSTKVYEVGGVIRIDLKFREVPDPRDNE